MPEKMLRVFMEPWEAKNLIEVIEEEFEHGVIYWFHWPYDGLLLGRDDYEPIAVIRRGSKLAARPHYRLRWTDEVLVFRDAPVAVFLSPWHHPMIHWSDVATALKYFRRFLVEVDYQPIRGEVPRWFRTAGLKTDFRDYAAEVSRDPLNMWMEIAMMDLADYAEIAEKVSEAISLLEAGDLEESLEVCRWIAAEIRGKSAHSGALLELIQPFIDHVDEHGMPRSEEERRRFVEYLKRYLECLRTALDSILGRE